MENFNFIAYKKMVKTYQENNDPTGWFDFIYKKAQGDFKSKMDEFVTIDKLTLINFLAYDNEQIPSVSHFFTVYRKLNFTK